MSKETVPAREHHTWIEVACVGALMDGLSTDLHYCPRCGTLRASFARANLGVERRYMIVGEPNWVDERFMGLLARNCRSISTDCDLNHRSNLYAARHCV